MICNPSESPEEMQFTVCRHAIRAVRILLEEMMSYIY